MMQLKCCRQGQVSQVEHPWSMVDENMIKAEKIWENMWQICKLDFYWKMGYINGYSWKIG